MVENNVNLNNLLIYRNILNDEIIKKLQLILEQDCSQNLYYRLYSELINKAEQLQLKGNILKKYLLYLIAKDENIFSKTAERVNDKLDHNSSLYKAALHDIRIIKEVSDCDLQSLFEKSTNDLIGNFIPTTNEINPCTQLLNNFLSATKSSTPNQLLEQLIQYYSYYGSGIMSDYASFRWNSNTGLNGISNFDRIKLKDITGYERQKKSLVENTCAFINNKPSNNILLMGSSGTGKSSSVKALINEDFARNLRLVEVLKHDLNSLPKLFDILRNHCQKFIIFLDDLSFEEFEIEYKYLKSIIDGGIETIPENVLIYATSNRMHLVKESWNDRKGDSDDVHRFDTLNEKLSLSDRFGITLTYLSPNQEEYLNIIKKLAIKHNIDESFDTLKIEALKWERQHNGRSGRTAQQFINYFLSKSPTIGSLLA